jgi:hypothetical protein
MIRGQLKWGRDLAARMAGGQLLCVRQGLGYYWGDPARHYDIYRDTGAGLQLVATAAGASDLWETLALLSPTSLVCEYDLESGRWVLPETEEERTTRLSQERKALSRAARTRNASEDEDKRAHEARLTLAAFDAAHPEIVRAIRAEREANASG